MSRTYSLPAEDSWDDVFPTVYTPPTPIEQPTERRNHQVFRKSYERTNRRSGDNRETIKIPSSLVGKVIGKGGCQIKEVQQKSGATVKVTNETEDFETFVNIFGNADVISKAKALIYEIVEEKPKERYVEPTYVEPKQPDTQVIKHQGHTIPEEKTWAQSLAEFQEKEDEYWKNFPKIIKNFYREHPEVSALTEEEVYNFREDNNNIVVDRIFGTPDSKPIPNPVSTFEHAFADYPEILDEIKKAGFTRPTPIQCQSWPVLMSGEDMIGISQTGSGKTLAFLLPAFIHIEGQVTPKEERKGPAVLVVAPTRELALQIDKEVKKYKYKGITSCCIYGGADRRQQVAELKRGVDIVIATPGRMNDLHAAEELYVENITYVVLDEADRMLDMGFEAQIRRVMYSVRPTRQTVMTSATWPPGVRRLASSYTNDPIQVYIGSLDLAATHSVTQIIHMITEDEKEQILFDFFANMGPDDKVIVFCGTKAVTDYISVECAMKRLRSTSIHSNRDQRDRELAIEDITSGRANILVATDVASRGLDIDDVTHIINYDFPHNIEEYVHRVGRTGRAGKTGESISYFTKKNSFHAMELLKILEEAKQFIPEKLRFLADRHEDSVTKNDFRKSGERRFNNHKRRF